MSIEYEIKFRATPEQLYAMEKELCPTPGVLSMETTYYDTEDGALSARKCTLRRRLENGISICTLKTPAGALGRGEFQVFRERIEDATAELCKLSGMEELAPLTEGRLMPVCGARFTRKAQIVSLPGCTLELALDRGVLTGGGKEIPLCEVEAELKDGTREALAAYGLDLAALYGLQIEKKSKFRRALDLAKGEK